MKKQKQQIDNQPQGEKWVLTCRHQLGEIYPGTTQHSCPVTIVTCVPGKPHQDQKMALTPTLCSALICASIQGFNSFHKAILSHPLWLGNRKCSVLSTFESGKEEGNFLSSPGQNEQDSSPSRLLSANSGVCPWTRTYFHCTLLFMHHFKIKSLASLLPMPYKVKQRKMKSARTLKCQRCGAIHWLHLSPLFQDLKGMSPF